MEIKHNIAILGADRMCGKPSKVVQEGANSDLAARYGSRDKPGHCSFDV